MKLFITENGKKEELKKQRFDRKVKLYYINMLKAYVLGNNKKMVYYGIMYIYKMDKNTIKTIDELNDKLALICSINEAMRKLTFNDIINMFPIKKDYDGEKFECKDYFSTIKYLNNFNLDEPIGENLEEFFWNYYNNAIIGYSVKEILLIDMVRMLDGKNSLMVDFTNEMGIDSYSINKEAGYIYNNRTGRTKPYREYKAKKPKHIKIVRNEPKMD